MTTSVNLAITGRITKGHVEGGDRTHEFLILLQPKSSFSREERTDHIVSIDLLSRRAYDAHK